MSRATRTALASGHGLPRHGPLNGLLELGCLSQLHCALCKPSRLLQAPGTLLRSPPGEPRAARWGGTAHLGHLAACSSSLATLIFLTAGTGSSSGLGAVHRRPSWDVGAARHLWSGERCPCTWQRAGIRWTTSLRSFKVPSKPHHCVIPCLCGLAALCWVPWWV